ncbi:MAG: DUF1573 domain-containing protein [Bacteroidia bacterium]|nr:DUF1573 domain-containing protein [Bacteroidia bacterium]
MKFTLLSLTFCAATQAAFGQIEFEKLIHDFGQISEGSVASNVFKFKNVGKQEVTLKSVKASCGCTTPNWTKTAVKPGETGEITVSYNSQGRPGHFTKSVTVVYDTAATPIVLTIKGEVLSAPQPPAPLPAAPPTHQHDGHDHNHHEHGSLDDRLGPPGVLLASDEPFAVATQYIDTVGSLAFDRTRITVGVLRSDQNKDFEIRVKNVGKKAVSFLERKDVKPGFDVKPAKKTLAAGEESVIVVSFIGEDSKKPGSEFKDRGPFNHYVSLYTDEKTDNQKTFELIGSYERVYTPEEIAAGPIITFEATEFDGGEVIEGQFLEHKFKFTNTGKSDLIIESAKASCGCTAIAPPDKVIKPGQSSEIVAKFDSKGKKGPQHKTITVTSNDLANPRVVLSLKCTIKPDPFGGSNPLSAPVSGGADY